MYIMYMRRVELFLERSLRHRSETMYIVHSILCRDELLIDCLRVRVYVSWNTINKPFTLTQTGLFALPPIAQVWVAQRTSPFTREL